MRKTFLLCIACSISMLMSAQLLEIVATQSLPIPQDEELKVAGFSPKGDYLLLTNGVNSGLKKYDLATGNINTISDADGAGWSVQISPDGKDIVYRERYMVSNQQLRNDIVKYHVASNKKATIAKEQRDLSKLMLANNTHSVAINEDLHIVLVRNGKSLILAPNGAEEAYNWVSLSPDGTKILYYVSGKGCYTCDLMGNNVQYIARDCRAPQWYNNHIIIGMHDEDNGKWLTASAIVAYDMQGNQQTLVSKERMAIYPYAANGKIAYSTAAGEIYLMTVK